MISANSGSSAPRSSNSGRGVSSAVSDDVAELGVVSEPLKNLRVAACVASRPYAADLRRAAGSLVLGRRFRLTDEVGVVVLVLKTSEGDSRVPRNSSSATSPVGRRTQEYVATALSTPP